MPLNADFSRSNRALARFNQFLQYDLLDQFRSDRDAALLQVSDKLQRERAVEQGQIDIGVAQYKSGLTEKEAYLKAALDISKQPHYDYLVSMAHMATDPNLPEQFKAQAKGAAEEYAKLILPLAEMAFKASRGEASWENYAAGIKGGGTKLMTDVMNESGQNYRANLGARTAEEANLTSRDRNAVDRERIAADREGRDTASSDEVTKRYINMIETSIRHLEAQGVTPSQEKVPAIFMENKALNPLDKANQDKALTGLVDLWQRVSEGGAAALTPGNKTFIQRVWNAGAWQGATEEAPAGGVLKRLKSSQGSTAGRRGPTGAEGPVEIPGGAPATGGGGINLETGSTPQEEQQAYAAIRRTLIEQKTQEFINAVYGQGTAPTPALLGEARKAAMEYVDSRLMPSISGQR